MNRPNRIARRRRRRRRRRRVYFIVLEHHLYEYRAIFVCYPPSQQATQITSQRKRVRRRAQRKQEKGNLDQGRIQKKQEGPKMAVRRMGEVQREVGQPKEGRDQVTI